MLRAGRLPAFLLFHGPEHLGKSTGAIVMAMTNLCRQPVNGWACGHCVSCRQVQIGEHPDCRILDGQAVSLGIETMREVVQAWHLRSWTTTDRWLILQHAEALTEAAANTMLKILEELPPGVRVMMTLDDDRRLLPTLRSRAASFAWHLVPHSEFPVSASVAPAHHQDLLARAAGRPGLYVAFQRDQSSWRAEQEQVEQLTRGFLQLAAGPALASSAKSDDLAAQLDTAELILREMILATVATDRRLWPAHKIFSTAAPQSIELRSLVAMAERYLQRHELLAAHVNMQLLSHDLALA